MTLDTLDRRVTDSLRASGFAELVLTKTGHGLGLDVHEAPQVMIGNIQAIEPGMVFTIEPGLYRQGDIGVRIEDDVLATPTRRRVADRLRARAHAHRLGPLRPKLQSHQVREHAWPISPGYDPVRQIMRYPASPNIRHR